MKRPLCATILLWLVLSLAAWSGVRLVTSIVWWARLSSFAPLSIMSYLVASALIWFCVSLFLFWDLIRGTRRGLVMLVFATVSFSTWYWIDRWLISIHTTNWGFTLGATILLLICVILCVIHPGTRDFFFQRENNEKKTENR